MSGTILNFNKWSAYSDLYVSANLYGGGVLIQSNYFYMIVGCNQVFTGLINIGY